MPRIIGLDHLDERDWWEIKQKGWFGLAKLELDDSTVIPLNFWDPVRLGQDLKLQFESGKTKFAEPNLIILPVLTEQAIRKAVSELLKNGFFYRVEVKNQ